MPSTTDRATWRHRCRPAWVAAMCAMVAFQAGCADEGDRAPESTGTRHTSVAVSTIPIDGLLRQGLDSLAAGDDALAKRCCRRVLALEPENVFAHYNLGLIPQRNGDRADAIVNHDAVLAVPPPLAAAQFNKGILFEFRDLPAALKLYRRAAAADDTFTRAWRRLGFGLHPQEMDKEWRWPRPVPRPAMADVKPPRYR